LQPPVAAAGRLLLAEKHLLIEQGKGENGIVIIGKASEDITPIKAMSRKNLIDFI